MFKYLTEAKGFLHQGTKPHVRDEYSKCFDCVVCSDCLGKCCLDQRRIVELQQVTTRTKNVRVTLKAPPTENILLNLSVLTQPPLIVDSMPKVKLSFDLRKLHPHLEGLFGQCITQEIIEKVAASEKINLSRSLIDTSSLKTPIACPVCEGLGYKHDPSSKHGKKKTERCKRCLNCKACNSSGLVVGKRACSKCMMRGFVHVELDGTHDVSENLRCFFCRDCMTCSGLGVEDMARNKI